MSKTIYRARFTIGRGEALAQLEREKRLTAAREAVVEAAKEQYMAFIKPTESDDRAIWLDKYVSACKWTQRNVAHLLEVESERAVASAKKEVGGE